uniref:Uncharacterized protein n=1 Tax=Romanomermis culicivorax TaxID=13658 RepID=A0A915HLI5_ROMCU
KIAIPAQFIQHDDLNLLIKNSDDGNREFFVVEKNLDWEKFKTYVQKRRSIQKFGLNLSNLLSNVREKRPSFFRQPEICSSRRKLKLNSKNSSSWRLFYDNFGSCDLYGNDANPSEPYYSKILVRNLLNDMLKKEIKSVKNLPGGTQVKLEATFINGYKAVVKPMR